MTDAATAGPHRVAPFAGDPRRKLDFHAGVLGLRPVERTDIRATGAGTDEARPGAGQSTT